MSQLNIKGIIANIKERTNAYTPLVEAVVNSIQAIEETKRDDGKITITIKRSFQKTLDFEEEMLPEVSSVEIQDNGIGFTQKNRDSFDTLYSNYKVTEGGKGFGRFMFLKYYEHVKVESIFKDKNVFYCREFDFGSDEDIIINERTKKIDDNDTKTILYLENIKERKLDKKLETIARRILEKLLIYFVDEKFNCPKIILRESGKKGQIILNDYLTKKENGEIYEINGGNFILENGATKESFQVRIFKILYPRSQRSKICLAAHNREVVETSLHLYIPEFDSDFYEEIEKDGGRTEKDYMIKAYVLGKYLDDSVSLERGNFDFSKESDMIYPFSQKDIESEAARIVEDKFGNEVMLRRDKKMKRIERYVYSEAPWHKPYLRCLDLSTISYNLTDEDIELEIQKTLYRKEKMAKTVVMKILENKNCEIAENANDIINEITEIGKSELAHYVALRRAVLEVFKKNLCIKNDGSYEKESILHNIVFPIRTNGDEIDYENHNLWIVDEKLNFTEYISSDQALDLGGKKRPDILIFNKKIAFRGGNETSNPITIFEFKRPQRDDFVNQSSKDDPVEQLIGYVNDIKKGKFKTPEGRDILVAENTPFYGFVICDTTQKVKEWLHNIKDFKQMPDGQGWFKWFGNINLYVEVLSWDKVFRDAELRNKIFFKKLGII